MDLRLTDNDRSAATATATANHCDAATDNRHHDARCHDDGPNDDRPNDDRPNDDRPKTRLRTAPTTARLRHDTPPGRSAVVGAAMGPRPFNKCPNNLGATIGDHRGRVQEHHPNDGRPERSPPATGGSDAAALVATIVLAVGAFLLLVARKFRASDEG